MNTVESTRDICLAGIGSDGPFDPRMWVAPSPTLRPRA
jgi:hypothetical protein